ncbi:Nudix hydrolase domain-containing protein [Plasmodiophora brassicae]
MRPEGRYDADGCRRVAMAVPVIRGDDGHLRFVLTGAQDGREWIFPKGGWELHETVEQAALREAYEECGVVGTVRCALGGEFRSGPSRSGRVTRVQAFLVDVDNLLDDWPERSVRARRLCTEADVRDALKRTSMLDLVDKALGVISSCDKTE